MMKPHVSILIFVFFILASVWSSIGSYRMTRDRIVSDLNQALEKTLRQQAGDEITPDTIRIYRSFLTIKPLRKRAYVTYCTREDKGDMACSDSMKWREKGGNVHLRAYANCSVATIFALSDQRLSLLFSLLAISWLAFSLYTNRKYQQEKLVTVGTLSYSSNRNIFYDARRQPLHFTPMQHQLMQMFLADNGRSLSKQAICDAFWPKKDDPSETLYTLIRRLKTAIEQHTNLSIVSERGSHYRLKEKS